jgi:hypothetical protein
MAEFTHSYIDRFGTEVTLHIKPAKDGIPTLHAVTTEGITVDAEDPLLDHSEIIADLVKHMVTP